MLLAKLILFMERCCTIYTKYEVYVFVWYSPRSVVKSVVDQTYAQQDRCVLSCTIRPSFYPIPSHFFFCGRRSSAVRRTSYRTSWLKTCWWEGSFPLHLGRMLNWGTGCWWNTGTLAERAGRQGGVLACPQSFVTIVSSSSYKNRFNCKIILTVSILPLCLVDGGSGSRKKFISHECSGWGSATNVLNEFMDEKVASEGLLTVEQTCCSVKIFLLLLCLLLLAAVLQEERFICV